ncbi:LysR family transcriptional regulator [Parahaliea maris]|uniref:LysR family transcriptional regulator n=1 Tax=Parahaliea maris TaxID=2716870 RepID=UPI00164FF03E|nr:LysR family transcriptional regulator [Parahaliea maris]
MDLLRKLWLFTQVADAGSFTKASQQTGMTVAAVSKNVSQLEAALGAKLLNRTTRMVQLTAEGQQLLEQAQDAFSTLQTAMQEVDTSQRQPSGLVRISSVTAYGRLALIPVLPELLQRYPGLSLDLSLHDSGHGPSRRGEDIHITWGEEYHGDKVCKRLMVMPLVLVASPGYLERHGAPKRPEELHEHECIGATLPSGAYARCTLRARGNRRGKGYVFQPRGRVTLRDELETVVDAAVAGLGITVVTELNVQRHFAEGTLARVLPDYEIEGHSSKFGEIVLQYPQRREMSARVQAVVDFLLEKLVTVQFPQAD